MLLVALAAAAFGQADQTMPEEEADDSQCWTYDENRHQRQDVLLGPEIFKVSGNEHDVESQNEKSALEDVIFCISRDRLKIKKLFCFTRKRDRLIKATVSISVWIVQLVCRFAGNSFSTSS